MHRRRACQLILLLSLPLLGLSAGVRAQELRDQVLSLYGMPLKDADAEAFLAAARAAGGVPLPDAAGALPELDMRGAGVPSLLRLTLISHEGRVASVRFLVKGYGQDSVELRGLLMGKYGVPMTVSARPLPFPAFADRAAPRGAFQWTFADGMKLLYEHPRVGDVTLSYIDEARMAALDASRLPGPARQPDEAVRNRF